MLSIGTICIVLIVCFGLLGASYASWTQTFSIFGTISTGQLVIVVRDVILESTNGYKSCSFSVNRESNIVDEVVMDVETESEPFEAVVGLQSKTSVRYPLHAMGLIRVSQTELK